MHKIISVSAGHFALFLLISSNFAGLKPTFSCDISTEDSFCLHSATLDHYLQFEGKMTASGQFGGLVIGGMNRTVTKNCWENDNFLFRFGFPAGDGGGDRSSLISQGTPGGDDFVISYILFRQPHIPSTPYKHFFVLANSSYPVDGPADGNSEAILTPVPVVPNDDAGWYYLTNSDSLSMAYGNSGSTTYLGIGVLDYLLFPPSMAARFELICRGGRPRVCVETCVKICKDLPLKERDECESVQRTCECVPVPPGEPEDGSISMAVIIGLAVGGIALFVIASVVVGVLKRIKKKEASAAAAATRVYPTRLFEPAPRPADDDTNTTPTTSTPPSDPPVNPVPVPSRTVAIANSLPSPWKLPTLEHSSASGTSSLNGPAPNSFPKGTRPVPSEFELPPAYDYSESEFRRVPMPNPLLEDKSEYVY